MAHGYLSPQDIRGNVDYLGMIGSAIGNRVKKASDMARAERKNATTQLGKQLNSQGKKGTLSDIGMEGRGSFFKRALGSTFGGDKIARTRGRFESDPPGGRDPTKTQAGRFRAGFDYTLSGPTAIQRTGGGDDDGVQGVNVQDLGPTGPSGGSSGGGIAGAFGGAVKGIGGLLAPASSAITPEVLPPIPAGSIGGGGAAAALSAPAIDTSATEIKDVVITLSKISALIAQSGNQTTQAIADSTRTTQQGFMSLAQLQSAISNRELAQQKQLAAAAQDQQEKMFARQLAASEAAQTAQGGDLSSNITPEEAGQGPLGRLGGLFGGGLNLLGDGLDMIGGRYMNRGIDTKRQRGARRRLARRRLGGARRGIGRAIGGGRKALTGLGAKAMNKGLQKTGVKIAGKGLAKGLGKAALKKVPGVGLIAGLGFGVERLLQGDLLGAGLELASGAASTVPGLGTAGSIGIDAALAARDMGVTPFATGGIIDDPTLGLVGEKGKEGVFPLEGAEGKKTFLMFGEGILEAQKKRQRDYTQLQAAGLSRYFDGQNGWQGFFDLFGKIKDAVGGPLAALARSIFGGGNNNPNTNGRNRSPGGGSLDFSKLGGDTPEQKAWLAAINATEAGGKDRYNTLVGGEVVPELTEMTLKEVYDMAYGSSIGQGFLPQRLGGRQVKYGADSHAAGAYQFHPATMKANAERLGLDLSSTKFTPEIQDKLALAHLMNLGVDPNKAMDSVSLAKAGSMAGWQGLSVENGHITESGALNLYQEMLAKARKSQNNTPDLEGSDPETPPEPPSSAQKISQNFGYKTGQRLYFEHGGRYYNGYKTTNGWDIYRGMIKMDTSGGKNKALVEALIKAGEAKVAASKKPAQLTPEEKAQVPSIFDIGAATATQQPDVLATSALTAANARQTQLQPASIFLQPTTPTQTAGLTMPTSATYAPTFSSSGTGALSLLSFATKN